MLLINLFGSPGCGKSTTALGLTYFLKMNGVNAEYVSEYVKDLVYKKDTFELSDQFNIFANQNNKLKVLESVDVVVTDSPIIFTAMYPNLCYPIQKWESEEQKAFEKVVVSHFKRYNAINIYLERTHTYSEAGRYQIESEANEIGKKTLDFLKQHQIDYLTMPTSPHVVQDILAIIEQHKMQEKIALSEPTTGTKSHRNKI